jgi:hypothetical protein
MTRASLRTLCIVCLTVLAAACQGPAAPLATATPAPTVDAAALTGQAQVDAWAAATGTALHLTALAPSVATTATSPASTAATDTLPPTATPTATTAPAPSGTPTVPAPTKAPPTRAPTPRLGPTASPTACAIAWFMTKAPAVCAGQAPAYSLTVAEHFQHGVMLWRQTPDYFGSQIYAFFFDNTFPRWNPSNDAWRTGDPESDPTIVPPAGLFQPVRGFGVFWRKAYFGAAAGSARDRLGWATDAEFSLGTQPVQCRSADSRNYGCYVAGPDDQVYDVEPNNQWSLWPPP